MARYTELLSEYIENGGSLPAVFDQIENFTELFTLKYADYEIGFETPSLFELKLNGLAELKIPAYKERIEDLQALEALALTGNKTRIKTGAIDRNYGERINSNSDLPSIPYDAGETGKYTPTAINKADTYTDTENYNNVTDTETGLTATEAADRITRLQGKVKSLIEECLEEFEPLFMQIY